MRKTISIRAARKYWRGRKKASVSKATSNFQSAAKSPVKVNPYNPAVR